MDDTLKTPLMENQYVKELLDIIGDSGGNAGNVAAMINHAAAVERFMESANAQLASMRRELAEMREIQNHPMKTALQNTVRSLQAKLNAAMEQLGEIKTSIIEGCKKALAAIKDMGKAALNGIMRFFHVKEELQSLSDTLASSIQEDKKAIVNIDEFSKQYHETGKAIGNMGRALTGEEMVTEVKPVGRIARTLQAPFRANIAINTKMRNAVEGAIGRLNELDAFVTEKKQDKTSVLKRLDENKERVARETLDRQMPERARMPLEATV